MSSAMLAVALSIAGVTAATAGAEHYRVTRHDDPRPGRCKHDDCSVREAIGAANRHPGRDTVVLPDRDPRYRLSRHDSGRDGWARGDLDVTGPITVRHGLRGRATVDAAGIDRVLDIRSGAPTKLARVKLRGGDARDRGAGGGVAASAPLRLVHAAVTSNSADTGGGIFSNAALRLNHSRVRGNHAQIGGGIDAHVGRLLIVRSAVVGNRAGDAGGGIAASGDLLRLGKSTVAGNVSGGAAGGVRLVQAAGRITKSTVNGNVARGTGGGIQQSDSELFVVNSTITGNRAGATGGGVQSSEAGGQVMLNSVTVARNVANASRGRALGGGLSAKAGAFGVVNSIVALNLAGRKPNDCHGTFESFGGNLLGTTAACRGFAGSALVRPDPKLGPLADNGGPTETLALAPDSPAIDKANQHREPTVDQRDRRRLGPPDIGAFERSP